MRVRDDAARDQVRRFYTTEQISENRRVTPEGFLLCLAVPMARTGSQVYAAKDAYDPDKMPEGVHPEQAVTVWRTPENVFRPETIASFAGKPVVNDHPEEDGQRVDVTPDNSQKFLVGVILNPRRGEGAEDNLLLADLMITRRDAIEAVLAGKTELSCGYDSEFVQTDSGRLEQTNIVGNHVALVDHGRCGPRCAIGDEAYAAADPTSDTVAQRRTYDMSKRAKNHLTGVLARLLKRAKTVGDAEIPGMAEEAAEEIIGEETGDATMTGGGAERDVHLHLHDTDPHGPTHAAGAEDPIPGLTDRVRDLEDAVRDMMRGHRDMYDGYRDMRRDWMHRDLAERRDEESEEEHDKRVADLRRRDEESEEDYDKRVADMHRDMRDRRRDARRRDEGAEGTNRAIEGALELEAPPGTGAADARKARDSRYLKDAFQHTLSLAEIIAPGIQLPTLDEKAAPRKTYDSIVGLRRASLTAGYTNPAVRKVIDDACGGTKVDLMALPPLSLRQLFVTVGTVRKQQNGPTGGGRRTADELARAASDGGLVSTTKTGDIKTVADFEKAAAAAWAK